MRRMTFLLTLLIPALLSAAGGFDPVKDVPITVTAGVLSMAIPKGVHLKARLFRVILVSAGTLQQGALPVSTEQDEAGDPIWRGRVQVSLSCRDLADPTRLQVTYQPCTEGRDGVCYLPVKRVLVIPAKELPTPRP